jgi:hypothetical protein
LINLKLIIFRKGTNGKIQIKNTVTPETKDTKNKQANQTNKANTNIISIHNSNQPLVTNTNSNSLHKSKKNTNPMDTDKIMFRKVDLDYIPGLDDDLKVILPASFEASLAASNLQEEECEKKIEEKKITEKKNEKQENQDENLDDFGPRPMLPYSSMFCFGPENW